MKVGVAVRVIAVLGWFGWVSVAGAEAVKEKIFDYLVSQADSKLEEALLTPSGRSLSDAAERLQVAEQLLKPNFDSLLKPPFKQPVIRELKEPVSTGNQKLATAYAVFEYARIHVQEAQSMFRRYQAEKGAQLLSSVTVSIHTARTLLATLVPDIQGAQYEMLRSDLVFLRRLEKSVTCADILPAPGTNLGAADFAP